MALRVDEDGQPKPESPSSLETLMVSRLAWLLRRLEAEPLEWAPEAANPALLGTVAHEVFEGLFAPDVSLPTREEIPERVEAALDDVLKRIAPFLRASQWTVERRHFTAQTIKAAQAWRDTIEQLGAEVVGCRGVARRKVERHRGAWSDGPDSWAAGGQAAGRRLQAIELPQATDADAEGVRQPGQPVSGDAREWGTEGPRQGRRSQRDCAPPPRPESSTT